VNARRAARLREKHRPELAGADKPDSQRLVFLSPLRKQTVEIHGASILSRAEEVSGLSDLAALQVAGCEIDRSLALDRR
jgi:hypothetical protein